MKKQIKQLVLVLSTAVIGGFLLAFILIWYYGPSGRYVAGQAILSPPIIQRITFKDLHPKTGQLVNFIFDHTEFVFFDYLRGSWQQKEVSSAQYSEFYNSIASDSSVDDLNDKILQFFNQPAPIALVTTVRTEMAPAAKIFQVIQFTKENYFRVKLHGQPEEGEWAYFYHPGVYQMIMRLFAADMK